MARKSRKNLNIFKIVEEQKPKFITGLYVRVSEQAGDSIETQKKIALDWLSSQEDIELYKIYADDGVSSFTAVRPAYTELLRDAKAKKINCIIVRDLSRFGRDYLETSD